MADWATISSPATAGGTLVLASATFAAVRSSNHAARAAEESLLHGLRPLLVPSRLDDPPQKIGFADGKWVQAAGSGGAAETSDEAIYLAIRGLPGRSARHQPLRAHPSGRRRLASGRREALEHRSGGTQVTGVSMELDALAQPNLPFAGGQQVRSRR